jgi:hypothetical protein
LSEAQSDTAFLRALLAGSHASARWAFADEALLRAIRWQERVIDGPRTAILRRIIGLADRVGLAAVVAGAIGLARVLLRLWLQDWHRDGSPALRLPPDQALLVFAGCGARAEDHIYESFRRSTSLPILRVGLDDLSRHRRAVRVRWKQALEIFWTSYGAARRASATLPAGHSTRRLDVLTSIAKHIDGYVYARVWWRGLRQQYDLRGALFIVLDHSAFAAIEEGVPSVFQQHGLLSRNLLVPRFDEVRLLTWFEYRYFAAVMPELRRSQILSLLPPRESVATRVLIVSGKSPVEEMARVTSLLNLLTVSGFAIHVRLFPGESQDRFWRGVQAHHAIQFENSEEAFADQLASLDPAAVAAWGSTTLAEALYRGTLPISLSSPGNPFVAETVYPIVDRSLSWPEEEGSIRAALASGQRRREVIAALQSREWALAADCQHDEESSRHFRPAS